MSAGRGTVAAGNLQDLLKNDEIIAAAASTYTNDEQDKPKGWWIFS